MKSWSKNMERYKLSEQYSIQRANPEEFSIYESVYGDKNINRFAVKHWDLRIAISLDNPFAKNESYYWIKQDEIIIGGVLIEPNVISRLFFLPPFTKAYDILKLLKRLLIKWSDSSKKIYAYQISPEQFEYFEMLGFLCDKKRRWMMRPTEVFDIVWDDGIITKTPSEDDKQEIAKLLYSSFKGGIDYQHLINELRQEPTIKDYLEEVDEYFDWCKENIFFEASTLIYSKKENKLVGACLVSYCEEWPLVHAIGVNPNYRGRQLASKMLKRALTVLQGKYPVLRLFVTLGNDAESVYHELGFVKGTEFRRLYIQANE